jgi:hypothetical protein
MLCVHSTSSLYHYPVIFMPAVTPELPLPINHVFVDFENVHKVDLTVIGRKAVSFTLLVGARQTRLDAALVEKLFEHAISVQLVRLASSGNNALDFTLAYYVGRAVAADPTGHFYIISKDTGFDPLIEHLRSRHISAWRHGSFEALPFVGHARVASTPATARKTKLQPQPKSAPATLGERETRVLEHFRKPSATRPRTEKTLVRFLVGYFGRKITETDALNMVEALGQAGHVVIGDKGKVTYDLEPK